MRLRPTILGAALFSALPVHATTFTVPTDFESIQDAIDAASAGDQVRVEPGTYVETLDFLGKSISVGSPNPLRVAEAERTVVDAAGQGSVVSFRSGERAGALLGGLTLTGGTGSVYAMGPLGGESLAGGGLFIDGASPSIVGCLIRSNQANGGVGVGGGVYAANGARPHFLKGTIEDNTARSSGGGASFQDAYPTLMGTVILRNRVIPRGASDCGCDGGLEINRSTALLYKVQIRENFAAWFAGGMDADDSDVLMQECVVRDNEADAEGGIAGFRGRLDLRQCNVIGNFAHGIGAGGIAFEEGQLLLDECVVSANETPFGDGGGIAVRGADLWIQDTQLTDNRAGFSGGGIYAESSSVGISRSVLVGNQAERFDGGGFSMRYGISLAMENNQFLANSSGRDGGGLYVFTRNGALTNNIFARNDAESGAGIYNGSDRLLVLNASIADNTASDGAAGIHNVRAATLKNCIVYRNHGPALIGAETEVTYSDVQGGWPGEGNMDLDPRFPVRWMLPYWLQPSSPCIDAGDPEINDQFSVNFPGLPDWLKNRARSDMGAYGGPANAAWFLDP